MLTEFHFLYQILEIFRASNILCIIILDEPANILFDAFERGRFDFPMENFNDLFGGNAVPLPLFVIYSFLWAYPYGGIGLFTTILRKGGGMGKTSMF